jgi:hypothetical protein
MSCSLIANPGLADKTFVRGLSFLICFVEGDSTMAGRKKLRIAPVSVEFDYQSLKPADAEKLRRTAKRIKERIIASLRSIIEAGEALSVAKSMLPHGQFGAWLEAEFGWTDRMARHFMDVAEHFGAKTEIISDLTILPSAAYLLAAPSTPFEARQEAIDRAKRGEKITARIAREIIRMKRKSAPRRGKPLPPDRFTRGLRIVLRRFQDRCLPDKMLEYAHQLHQFASELEKECRAAADMMAQPV